LFKSQVVVFHGFFKRTENYLSSILSIYYYYYLLDPGMLFSLVLSLSFTQYVRVPTQSCRYPTTGESIATMQDIFSMDGSWHPA
jgi:hypothetical protein